MPALLASILAMSEHQEQFHAERASKGGAARMQKLSREERGKLARTAANARWEKTKNQALTNQAGKDVSREDDSLPVAKYPGELNIVGTKIPVYVLSNGQRVIARIAATEMLTGIERQADLESYLRASALKPFIDAESVVARMVSFRLADVDMLKQQVKGLPSDLFIEICRAYVDALKRSEDPSAEVTLTPRQRGMAMRAGIFLAACAKVGLDALIDEATGYQYIRPEDALALKLKLYLEEEMRKWEKTFPDQLWEQFGRLTNWKGRVNQRPKYWGQLVMKLIYEYLDPDVAQWLRDNAPKPMRGQNYHQWLSSQYGLKKLVEHIWKVIGIASVCSDIEELKRQMERLYGKKAGFQFELRLKA